MPSPSETVIACIGYPRPDYIPSERTVRALHRVWCREPRRRKVLQRVRYPARDGVPAVWVAEPSQRKVLLAVRGGALGTRSGRSRCGHVARSIERRAGRCRPRSRDGRSGRRAPARHGPVRRPRRLHAVLRGPRRRGGPRDPEPVLRPRPRHRSSATAARSRSSSATRSWPSGARRSRTRTTRSGRSAPRSSSSTRSHARAPGSRRGPGVLTGEAAVTIGATEPGHGRRRPREHRGRLQSARGAGHRPRRRGDAAGRVRGHRLRGGRRADAEGQERAGAGVARAPRRGRARRPRTAARRSRRRSSVATRSCGCSRTCSTPRGREGRPRLVSIIGPGGHRQEPAGVGVPEVPRRARRGCWWHDGRSPAYGEGITFWALGEMVRGARRPGGDATTRRPRARGIAAMLAEHVPDEEERRWIEPALLALLGFEDAPVGIGAAVRRVADVLRAPGGGRTRSSWSSRTCTTPTPACSTSSTT